MRQVRQVDVLSWEPRFLVVAPGYTGIGLLDWSIRTVKSDVLPGVNAPIADRSDRRSDDDLVRLLAGGDQAALGPLYARYAPLIFNVAVQSLEGPGAEEVVQDVFLSVWRKAAVYPKSSDHLVISSAPN